MPSRDAAAVLHPIHSSDFHLAWTLLVLINSAHTMLGMPLPLPSSGLFPRLWIATPVRSLFLQQLTYKERRVILGHGFVDGSVRLSGPVALGL